MLSPLRFSWRHDGIGGKIAASAWLPCPGRPEDLDYLLAHALSRVEGMAACHTCGARAVKADWRSFGEYLDKIDGTLAINKRFHGGPQCACVARSWGARAVTDSATARLRSKPMSALAAAFRSKKAGVGFFDHHCRQPIPITKGHPVPSARGHAGRNGDAWPGSSASIPGPGSRWCLGSSRCAKEHYALGGGTCPAAGPGRPLNWERDFRSTRGSWNWSRIAYVRAITRRRARRERYMRSFRQHTHGDAAQLRQLLF